MDVTLDSWWWIGTAIWLDVQPFAVGMRTGGGWGGARGENSFWYFLMWLYGIAWTQNVPIAPSYLGLMDKASSKLCFARGFSGEGVHFTYGCNNFENLILFSTTNCKSFFSLLLFACCGGPVVFILISRRLQFLKLWTVLLLGHLYFRHEKQMSRPISVGKRDFFGIWNINMANFPSSYIL